MSDFPYYEIDDNFIFPEPEEGNSIVCHGGNLSPGLLKSAYMQGVFPWYGKDEPVLWWSPDPRFVLKPVDFHIPESLKRFLKKNQERALGNDSLAFTFTQDVAFEEVIRNCSAISRAGQFDTWILEEVIEAYIRFHELGYAHSYETWQQGELVGGFYGVSIGQVFFGESMFSKVPEASKSVFVRFVEAFVTSGGKLIDSQVYTDHIARFGGKNISRNAFLQLERQFLEKPLSSPIELARH
jgi:leucyl/phenylalanyl-tRNA--protein transferase